MDNVLMVSWAWAPVGGDWTYIANMERLYKENGYNVIPFSTKREDNVPNDFEEYFVTAYDYKELNQKKSLINGYKTVQNAVVSFEALKNLEKLLDKYPIKFAHFHIIHHWVTPAIIKLLKERNIPIIWTLHEYKLLCPEGTFVSNGTVCEKCRDQKFYNCALNSCKKGSFLASSLAAFDAYYYKQKGYYNDVNYYLCPSAFLKNKFDEFGFQREKLLLTNYCYDIAALDAAVANISLKGNDSPYILYVGRIERLKGIVTLLEAVRNTTIHLKIAGTGAFLEGAKQLAEGMDNVEFLGFQHKDDVYRLTLNSEFVVCPSEWYENYPFSVIESLLLAKPVVGSDMGGIPELVLHEETGLVHKAGNVEDLRKQLLRLWENKEERTDMGRKAREFACSKVSFDVHWDIMKSIINRL
jgi:glycosyltransferase involved in cell wall biosynthesis